jgi:hypothetical protein
VEAHEVSELVGYVEYIESSGTFVGEIIGYVEYTGAVAGAFTIDIPSVGEIIGYVEYIELSLGDLVGEIIGYVEYIEPSVSYTGEIIGYVEYTGAVAGAFTIDIPSVGEIIGYVEYITTSYVPPPPRFDTNGPHAWII